MKKYLFLTLLFSSLYNSSTAQSSYDLVLQPDMERCLDAVVITNPNDNNIANSNYWQGSIGAYHFGTGTIQGSMRTFIKFSGISHIPPGATIISAKLSFFGLSQSEFYSNGNVGSNSCLIKRVANNWDDTLINWNNQPYLDTTNQVLISPSTSQWSYDALDIDVTSIVQTIYSEGGNFGFGIMLQDESQEAALLFNSGESQDFAKKPILKITLGAPAICLIPQVYNAYFFKGQRWKSAKDAPVFQLAGSNAVDVSGTNFGTLSEMNMSTWTFGGTPGTGRTYLEFDQLTSGLSSLSTNYEVLSARLFLYGIPTSSSAPQGNCGSCAANGNTPTSNECWINRVTSPWTENTITWNNQSSTGGTNLSEIPQAQSNFNWDLNSLDVTDVIKEMFVNPNQSYGFRIQLKNQTLSSSNTDRRSLLFASCEYPNVTNPNLTKTPRLEMVLAPKYPSSFETTIELPVISNNGEDARLVLDNNTSVNYGNENIITAGVYRTGSGRNLRSFNERSLLRFDLSSLPSNAFVTSASLNLYSAGIGNTGNGVSWLNRSLSTWNESTVTWLNQPAYSEINRVYMPQPTSGNSYNIINLNVTKLVHDVLKFPNYGFTWRVNNETASTGSSGSSPNRQVVFASSDNSNSVKRPKLVVKYISQCTPGVSYLKTAFRNDESIENTNKRLNMDSIVLNSNTDKINSTIMLLKNSFILMPNPAKNKVTIALSIEKPISGQVLIYNAGGKLSKEIKMINLVAGFNSIEVDLNGLSSGVYFVELQTTLGLSMKKLIIQ